MPTLAEAARVTVKSGAVWCTCAGCGLLAALPPGTDRREDCRTRDELAALMPYFPACALSYIHFAGCLFAGAIADIAHHEIAGPGSWDCHGSVPDELVRLRRAMDRMAGAIKQTRAELAAIERRARRAQLAAERGRRT